VEVGHPLVSVDLAFETELSYLATSVWLCTSVFIWELLGSERGVPYSISTCIYAESIFRT